MAVEERLAYVEGRVEEHAHVMDGTRDALVSLEQRMDRRFEAVDHRFDAVDHRFDAIDRRFDAVDRRFDAIDRRFERADERLDGLDTKISRQFMWLVGIQLTTLTAIVAALVAR